MSDARPDPTPCDYDLENSDNQQALWMAFQRDGEASCPVTGAAIEPSESDPSETGEARVRLSCSGCGRGADFGPPAHDEVSGWAE